MQEERYQIVTVPSDAERSDETLGTKFKFWFREGGTGSRRTLFKAGRENEDWSEKVAAELAALLGLAHAEVDLAIWDNRLGIVSPSFLPRGSAMFFGNQLLFQGDPEYPRGTGGKAREHTLTAVLDSLDRCDADADPEFERPWKDFDGRDQFIGYVLLDAWIGNTDRHHENWGIIRQGESCYLAPTFDHAASLGRNEPDRKMDMRLRGNDKGCTVRTYVDRAYSALFRTVEETRPMTTLEAFQHAAQLRPRASEFWLERLAELKHEAFENVLHRIPDERISKNHRTFAQEILTLNRDLLENTGLEAADG